MRFSWQSAEQPVFSAWIPSTSQNGSVVRHLNASIQNLIEEKTFTRPLLNSDPETKSFVRVKKHAEEGRRWNKEERKDIRKFKEILHTKPEVH